MGDFAEMLRELDALEGLQIEIATIATRTDPQRQHDLIQLRRKLSDQIARTGHTGDSFFGKGDPEVARTYRAKFSRMRSSAAMHQANWPAVRLGESVEEYRASAAGVREANRDFVAWMRHALVSLERG